MYSSNALKKNFKLICAKTFKSLLPNFKYDIFNIRVISLDDIPWTCLTHRPVTCAHCRKPKKYCKEKTKT